VRGVERDDVGQRLHRRARGQAGEVGVEVALELRGEDVGEVLRRARRRDLDRGRAECLDRGDRGLVVGVGVVDDADALAAERVELQRRGVVGDRGGRRVGRRVLGVLARDRLQLGGRVGDGLGHRAGGVLRRADREDAGARDQADRGPQADVALRGGRADDRAGGLGADRDRGQAGRRGRAAAGGRPGRRRVDVVRVQHLAAERRVAARHAAGHEVRELGQVRLAEDHRAGGAQARDDRGVLGRDRALERDGARRRGQAGDVEVVLDQHRDAV
jgi:hypothetical protein